MQINIAWQEVDTVLLDMDGTLLDLASTTTSGKNWSRKPGARARTQPAGSQSGNASGVSRRAAYAKLVLS